MTVTLADMLKQEITRLSRKATKAELQSLRSASAAQRKQIASLRQDLVQLERQIKALNRTLEKTVAPASAGTLKRSASKGPASGNESDDAAHLRFRAGGLKTLRTKLGLSAADFGRLVGVSGQSIYLWETGKTRPRPAQLSALAEVRGIGKREATRRLAEQHAEVPAETES